MSGPEQEKITYTAAITTAASDVTGDFCDVTVIENVIHGYTTDGEGNEVPDYGLSDTLAMRATELPIRTDDDDVLGKVEDAAEAVLTANGWRITGEWDVADNALYASAERILPPAPVLAAGEGKEGKT